jgi:6-phospho-beta-glucosidase
MGKIELPTQLPKDFFLGAAMSGPQTEGAWQATGKLPNLWDRWSNLNITDFYNLVGSYGGNDFTRRRDEDIQIFKDLGLDSVRTSIQWSRLMDKDGKLNQAGADYYHELFAAFRKGRHRRLREPVPL